MKRDIHKRAAAILMAAVMALSMAACSKNVACINCHNGPSKGYKHKGRGETLYYCKNCSSRCDFCRSRADRHYESLVGIVFVCDKCYEKMYG